MYVKAHRIKIGCEISIYNKPSIISDYGLILSGRQATIWTDDGLVYQGIYVSLDGLNELKFIGIWAKLFQSIKIVFQLTNCFYSDIS